MKYNEKSDYLMNGLLSDVFFINMQKKINNATGFSMYIIDYTGKCILNNKLSDATNNKDSNYLYAINAAKSAIDNEIVIFTCKRGLFYGAIPIIYNNQYIGAIICGQVSISDKQNIKGVNVEYYTKSESDFISENKSDFSANTSTFHEFKSVCELINFFTNEFLEKTYLINSSKEDKHLDKHLSDIRNKYDLIKKSFNVAEKQLLRMKLMPEFFYDFLTDISNIAILEEAENTADFIEKAASVIRYYLHTHSDRVMLKQELSQLETYLDCIKQQYYDKFKYNIEYDNSIDNIYVPLFSIFSFTEYILNNYALLYKYEGILTISVTKKDNINIIKIKFSNKMKKNSQKLSSENISSLYASQINNTTKRYKLEFGNECNIKISSNNIIIKIPDKFYESEISYD